MEKGNIYMSETHMQYTYLKCSPLAAFMIVIICQVKAQIYLLAVRSKSRHDADLETCQKIGGTGTGQGSSHCGVDLQTMQTRGRTFR